MNDNAGRAATLRRVNPTWERLLAGLEWLPRPPEEQAKVAASCPLRRCRHHRRCRGGTPEAPERCQSMAAGTA